MPIRSDTELAQAALDVGRRLQEIQDYLGQEPNGAGKIRFPRGFIRTAEHFRSRLTFVLDADVRANISYALILLDVYRWLTNRTDLFGTAREMVVKAAVVLAGSICEAICVCYTHGQIGRNCRFKVRCTRMRAAGMLNEELEAELHWLWDTRSGIHISDVSAREYERYSLRDYNRAVLCLRSLREQLDQHSSENAAF